VSEEGDTQGFYFGNASGLEVTPDERRGMLPDTAPLFGNESTDDPDTAISSLREMLITQGRRIESLNAETQRKDSAPLKFLPKKNSI
jgi:hypothetical protein